MCDSFRLLFFSFFLHNINTCRVSRCSSRLDSVAFLTYLLYLQNNKQQTNKQSIRQNTG